MDKLVCHRKSKNSGVHKLLQNLTNRISHPAPKYQIRTKILHANTRRVPKMNKSNPHGIEGLKASELVI